MLYSATKEANAYGLLNHCYLEQLVAATTTTTTTTTIDVENVAIIQMLDDTLA
jgi:hypothetical protein